MRSSGEPGRTMVWKKLEGPLTELGEPKKKNFPNYILHTKLLDPFGSNFAWITLLGIYLGALRVFSNFILVVEVWAQSRIRR